MSLRIDKPDKPDSKKSEIQLPKALEEALALTQRALMMGPDVMSAQDTEKQIAPPQLTDFGADDIESDEENDMNGAQEFGTSKADKNKRKKQKKKQNRKKRQAEKLLQESKKKEMNGDSKDEGMETNDDSDVEVEYVPEKITVADLAPQYRTFYRVFEIFKLENKPKEPIKEETPVVEKTAATKKTDRMDEDDDDQEDEKKDDKEKMSKRKLKKLTRLSVAELKQLVNRPDVVEMHDVTARDPKLLVQLKAHRNTVQVPRHWCFKRKYLQGKRGIEKPPFDLPAFIKKTGIMEMRASLQEKDEAKTMKAKMRERVRPKMGKIDIDYQKLHDAFFK